MTGIELSTEVQNRIRWAAEYIKAAEGNLQKMLAGGQILRVEGKQDEVCRALDMICGTDYIYVYPKMHHAWGIACRVQKYDYANFTVRVCLENGAVTELDKRRIAIRNNGIYPYLTMQMFVNDKDKTIRRIGITRTADLIDAIDNGLYEQGRVMRDSGGKSTFYAVDWKRMQDAGYKVLTYEAAG